MVDPFLPDDEKLAAVREALPATSAGIYLNTGSAGPLPRETATAMSELEAWELRTGRADPGSWEDSLLRMAEARATIAAVLSTDPARIALTHATTDGMNVACWSIDWRPGERVVTTNLEHPGTLGPLWALRRRLGVEVEQVDLGDAGDDERTLEALDRAIGPGTRLVALSHVSFSTGARLPVERIAALAHERGALLAVDGAQSVGAVAVAAEDLGADFYAVAAQKWLLGPEGVGALYCGPAALDELRITFAGGFSFEAGGLPAGGLLAAGQAWPDARRFEASNYHRPSIAGMARSCAWLSMYVGLPWIFARTATLASLMADTLAAIPGVELLTPRNRMAGLVSFRVAGWPAERALDELSRRTFTIARTIPSLDAVRLSVGFFNTEAEIGRVGECVALLAAHTPETLPPRPAITVLGG